MDSRGSVLVLKKDSLLQELDKRKRKENAVATSQAQEVKGKTRCHQSNRLLRHERVHEAHVRSREQRLVAQLLACQVSPTSGGTNMQASSTPYTLQRWQALGTSCAMVRKEMGNESGDQTKPQDQQWVVVSTNRKPVSCDKENKEKNAKMKKVENVHDEEDDVLLIVRVRIYGKVFRALVDSGASRCFISSEVVQTAQL